MSRLGRIADRNGQRRIGRVDAGGGFVAGRKGQRSDEGECGKYGECLLHDGASPGADAL